MKKILILVMIVLFVLGTKQSVIKEYTHITNDSNNENVSEQSNPTEPPEEKQLNATLTVSAVGDCTLATDPNYGGAGSFVSEIANQNNDYTYFLKNVKQYFESDDLTIVNFEGTLSENGSRADKQFAFRGKPEYSAILTSSSVEAANLANNHTKDYGLTAFNDTKTHLSDVGISVFEGLDVSIREINGVKIAMIGINALNDTHRGYFDEALQIANAENPDLLIVSFHWGIERATSPNDTQTTLAYKAIDNGADLVIGHHPHVLQGIEKYKGKYILYSLGNFCFGGNKNSSDKDTMIFQQKFTFADGSLVDDDNINIIPCSISSVKSRNDFQPTPLTGSERDRVINKITGYSSLLPGDAVLKFN